MIATPARLPTFLNRFKPKDQPAVRAMILETLANGGGMLSIPALREASGASERVVRRFRKYEGETSGLCYSLATLYGENCTGEIIKRQENVRKTSGSCASPATTYGEKRQENVRKTSDSTNIPQGEVGPPPLKGGTPPSPLGLNKSNNKNNNDEDHDKNFKSPHSKPAGQNTHTFPEHPARSAHAENESGSGRQKQPDNLPPAKRVNYSKNNNTSVWTPEDEMLEPMKDYDPEWVYTNYLHYAEEYRINCVQHDKLLVRRIIDEMHRSPRWGWRPNNFQLDLVMRQWCRKGWPSKSLHLLSHHSTRDCAIWESLQHFAFVEYVAEEAKAGRIVGAVTPEKSTVTASKDEVAR